MGTLTIRFRGLVAIARNEGDPSTAPLVFILPNAIRPRLSTVRPEFMIAAHYPYLTIPHDAIVQASDAPRVMLEMVDHALPVPPGAPLSVAQNLRPQAAAAKQAVNRMSFDEITAMTLDRNVDRLLPSFTATTTPKFNPSHLYYIWGYEIILPGIGGGGVDTSNTDDIVPLSAIAPGADTVSASVLDKVGAACAFFRASSGRLMTETDREHNVWFLHGLYDSDRNQPAYHGSIAHDVKLQLQTDGQINLQLNRIGGGKNINFVLDTSNNPELIIGNEPLDDFLGVYGSYSCNEPAYAFEVLYDLSVTPPREDLKPVPLCANVHGPVLTQPHSPCYGIVTTTMVSS